MICEQQPCQIEWVFGPDTAVAEGSFGTKQLQKNDDGSVDIYFGPKAPKGKESNWLPTDPKRRFEVDPDF